MSQSALRPAAHFYAPRGSGVVQRFGFTILELMIVLMLLVAITGLVMPSVLNRLNDSLATSALDQIEAVASESRSKAQQEGNALRLIARERPDGSVGLYIEEIGQTESIALPIDEPTNSAGDEFGSDVDLGLLDAWDKAPSSPAYVLPTDFSFTRSLPQLDEGIFNDPLAFQDSEVGGNDALAGPITNMNEIESMTLAVFLPDGTAIVERPLYLTTGEDTFEIEISRWTGRVTTTRLKREDELGFDSGFGDEMFESDAPGAGAESRSGGGP